jgi:hypothetical protein
VALVTAHQGRPDLAIQLRLVMIARAHFQQGTLEPCKVGQLPGRAGAADFAAVEIDQPQLSVRNQNIVRVQVGVIHSRGMKARD